MVKNDQNEFYHFKVLYIIPIVFACQNPLVSYSFRSIFHAFSDARKNSKIRPISGQYFVITKDENLNFDIEIIYVGCNKLILKKRF